MESKDILATLRKITLFSIYTDAELSALVDSAQTKSVSSGEIIFKQGEEGDKFYIVASGKIRIVLHKEDQKEINLGVRTEGDYFGETALITGNPRNATARAAEPGVLISISGDAFNDFLLSKPDLREHFDKFIKHTSIHRFLETSTDLSVASPDELKKLSQLFTPEFYSAGEAVIRQGTDPDNFYLIEKGKAKVVHWENKKPEIINLLHKGDFFGEKALIEKTKRYADVICLTDCHLFSLSRDAFDKFVAKPPKLRKAIEDRIKSYHAEKPPIPYKEMIKQELAASKAIKVHEALSEEELKPSKEKEKYFQKLTSYYRKRISFPFISQHDQMTCGTTCIMMIAKYYGKNFASGRLRELAHVDLSGTSMANLASAAEQLGFSTRGMKLDYNTLMSIHLPCIVHWKGYHYIVVYKIDDKNVWISDPAIGHRKYTRDYFEKNWNGITLTLEPTIEFERTEEDKSSFRNFLQFIVPHRLILLEIFVASLLLNLFGLATPIFTQNIVDKVLTQTNISMLNIMFLGMLVVIIFRLLTMIIRQYLIVHTGMKIDLKMLVQFYKHLLALPLGYFKVRKVGDFITRFGENLKIRNFLTETALSVVLDSILIIVYLSLMFYYNPALTGLALLMVPVIVGLTLIFTPILKKLNISSFTARAESQSHLIESIHAVDTIKATNTEYPTRWKWEDKYIKSLNLDFKLFNTAIYFHSIGDFVGTFGSTFILWYGAHTVINGGMSVGELMAFMALLGSVVTPINRIVKVWDDIQQTLVSVDRINEVFIAKPELVEYEGEQSGIIIKEPIGKIEFENVYFRYGGEDDPYILSNINFKVLPGKRIAIVGRSGSGKTTLARLIARFYDATEGKIMIDDYNIKNINLFNLRKFIGFVLQEDFIFNATIRENISLGDQEETMERIIEAAKLANAHDFITDLVSGYDTPVGESGLQLSGGQKQRITIARVLYAKPKIIILDEATSFLDSESEMAIQKNLNEILKDKTAIIIAHRLSTVRDADEILVLDKGEIVERGTHEELIEEKGLYHFMNYQQLNI